MKYYLVFSMSVIVYGLFVLYLFSTGLVVMPLLLILRNDTRRRFAHKMLYIWTKFYIYGVRFVCGIKFNVVGSVNVEGPCILAAKHYSSFDVAALLVYFNKPLFIVKEQIKYLPVFGRFLAAAGMIFTDRKGNLQSMRNLRDNIKNCSEKYGTNIVLYPEGTRTGIGDPPIYKKGAICLAAKILPIIPIASNIGKFFNKYGLVVRSGNVYMKIYPMMSYDNNRDNFMNELESVIEGGTQELLEMD